MLEGVPAIQDSTRETAPAVGRLLVIRILVSLLTSRMRSMGSVASTFCTALQLFGRRLQHDSISLLSVENCRTHTLGL